MGGELEYQKKSLEKAVALDAIATRRKGKKEHEYECKWKGYSMDFLTWVNRTLLIEMGYKTQVQREDEKQAAMAGLQNKQLTTPGVEKHLADFGVPAEFATHNHLRSLSAGQKVKVVLGAAMWQNPHILVIDEPTNYLDRDALGALTEAIETWSGGVVVISHNLAFCDRVATEKWIMDAGHLRAERCEKEGRTFRRGNVGIGGQTCSIKGSVEGLIFANSTTHIVVVFCIKVIPILKYIFCARSCTVFSFRDVHQQRFLLA